MAQLRLPQNVEKVLDAIADRIAILDDSYGIVFANKTLREAFGDRRGQPCYEAFFGGASPCPNCTVNHSTHHCDISSDSPDESQDRPLCQVTAIPLLRPEGTRLVMATVRNVTAQRKQEDALQHREEYYQRLLENASDVAMILGADGTIRYVSPAVRRLIGFDPEELIGRTGFELLHPDDVSKAISTLAQVVQTPGGTASVELRVGTKDGSWRVMEGLGKNLLHDPAVSGVLIDWRDVTERKEAEATLLETQQRFYSLAENASDMILVLGPDMTVSYVGPSVERLTGYTPLRLMGKSPLDYVHPEDIPLVQEGFAETVQRNGIAPPVEFRLRHADGTWGHYEVIANNLLHDPVVNGVVINARDIAERKRAEAEYKAIVDTTVDGFWIVDAQGNFLDVNEAYCRLTGYSRDELLSLSIRDIEAAEASEETTRHMQRLVESGSDRFETRHRCKDGSIIEIEVSANYMDVAGGQLFVFLRDVSNRKKAEEEIQRRNRELAALNEVMKAVASSLKLDEVLDVALERATESLGGEGGWIRLFNQETDELTMAAHCGVSEELARFLPTRSLGGLAAIARRTERPAIVDDIETDERTRHKGPKLADGWRSQFTAPLSSPAGFVGTITLLSRQIGKFSAASEPLLTTMAAQIGLAVEKARLFSEAEQHHRDSVALNDALLAVSGPLEPADVLNTALDNIPRVVEADGGWIRLHEEQEGTFRLAAWRGISEELVEAIMDRPLDSRVGIAMKRGESILFNDVAMETSFEGREKFGEDGWHGYMAVPLQGRGGLVGGVVMVSQEVGHFNPRHLRLL
ncbi:MAG: PAS domain S-box protein, partial [Chloroflexota bacterium]